MPLDNFIELIRERSGLSFHDKKHGLLKDTLYALMKESELHSLNEYYTLVENDNGAFTTLINNLTINETYFYREPKHLEILCQKIVPQIISKKKPGETIKILSVGCSTGEEPYSILIALSEKFSEKTFDLFSISAFDIDKDAIDFAKKGIYNKNSFRNFPATLKEKFFRHLSGDLYEISPVFRSKVKFFQHNLIEKNKTKIFKEDIIFYRNVSIYFDKNTQLQVFNKLAGFLNANGVIFVGSVETASHDTGALSLVRHGNIFYYCKCNINRENIIKPDNKKIPLKPNNDFSSENTILRNDDSLIKYDSEDTESNSIDHYKIALNLVKEKNYNSALPHIDSVISSSPNNCKAYAFKAYVLMNIENYDKAISYCNKSIEQNSLCFDPYFVLGLIQNLKSNNDEATKAFKSALYIKPTSWLCHFHLANIYKASADYDAAKKQYALVIKFLEKTDMLTHELEYIGFPFAAENFIHLCKKAIETLPL